MDRVFRTLDDPQLRDWYIPCWVMADTLEFSVGDPWDHSELSNYLRVGVVAGRDEQLNDDDEEPYEAENGVFGLSGEELRRLHPSRCQVLALEREAKESVDSEDEDGDEDRPRVEFIFRTGEHEYTGEPWANLSLSIHLSGPQFAELVHACENRKADELEVEASGRAFSTGWTIWPRERDLILPANELLQMSVRHAVVSSPAGWR